MTIELFDQRPVFSVPDIHFAIYIAVSLGSYDLKSEHTCTTSDNKALVGTTV